ncbi:relaxase/mobilization nuclease domain-containing protein [Pontibacter toksunensis]|uniref:Relaxase/mobilization nuclease domain-containing protein n=1 Tax=Pontibacter toksunensis TaxID=1332631 RepID=A0ABW6BT70_9BACT
MIGKVTSGKSFAGCVRYVVQKEGALVLEANGIRTDTVSAMVTDFNLQRSMNPELGKAVGHIALSWSVHDRPKLNGQVMAERAREYLEKMQIRDTQYLIVEHRDRKHPHLHIVYNRVDFQGRTITDKLQRHRNAEVCREMTLRHGYYLAPGKEQVNRLRLKGADKARYELHDAIEIALGKARNWQEMERLLQTKGVTLHYKYRRGTDQVQGISFCEGNISFRGSRIDRSLSYGAISKQLELNRQQERLSAHVLKPQPKRHAQPGTASPAASLNNHPLLSPRNIDLLSPAGQAESAVAAQDYHFRKKRKKKKRRHL